MDSDLKCNRLTCRRTLIDKAVVTTCSHIFCVDCANDLFTAAQLCPACETHLTEPDDVVVCSLHPSNDYKTSVLSGLSPSVVLEICGRAISFWHYQIHQESSFQQAVLKNVNERNAQLQKQLDNVVREANGEINLLSSKLSGTERDLDLERRKIRELQDTARERDKEYQKLKNQYDKIKRKALLVPNAEVSLGFGAPINGDSRNQERHQGALKAGAGFGSNIGVNIGAVVGGMEANGVQRTPIGTRGGSYNGLLSDWQQGHHGPSRNDGHNQTFTAANHIASHASISDRSTSADEVENVLGGHRQIRHFQRSAPQVTSNVIPRRTSNQQGSIQHNNGKRGGFRPAGVVR